MNYGATHPEMVRRFDRLVELVHAEGGTLTITEATRDRAEQEDLYFRWRLPKSDPRHYNVPIVADPNRVPQWKAPAELGGWQPLGSLHMPQADGRSHAIDERHTGITQDRFDVLAVSCGLIRPELTEVWHLQWWDSNGVAPAPALESVVPEPIPSQHDTFEDDDMQLIQCDDGDAAVFFRTGGLKSWVRDQATIDDAVARGWIGRNLDGTPALEHIGRNLLESLATVGALPEYGPDYAGPRTTV